MTGDKNHTENKEVERQRGKHAGHSFLLSPHSTCWLPSSNEAKEEGESGVDVKPECRREEGARGGEGGKMTLWINCPSC